MPVGRVWSSWDLRAKSKDRRSKIRLLIKLSTNFNLKHLLGIRELSADQINHLLDTAETFRDVSKREIKKVPALRGRTVINLFFEASTRTRTSFEIAAKRLSADAVNISVSTSSVSKGETLLDTARNLQAMSPDLPSSTLVGFQMIASSGVASNSFQTFLIASFVVALCEFGGNTIASSE